MKRTDGLYRLYRLMLSGYCTAHRTVAEDNKYVFEIRRFFPWEEGRTIKDVARYYYVTLTPDGVKIEAEEIEK